ncbi:MAG: hypothetical protein QM755_06560 [Luteolibacter sp.]
MNSPWPEWLACLFAALSAVLAAKHDRKWSIPAGLAVLAVSYTGSAGIFLLPTLAACVVMLLKPSSKWGLPLAFMLIGMGAGACWLFPEPALPPLPGIYKVGTRILEIPAEGTHPRLSFQIWYPGSGTSTRAPWLPDAALAPGFPFHRIKHADSRSWSNAPLVDTTSTLPILFYEHAWMGHRAENVAQVEDLASRGFVVIAIDHPGQATTILHADGSRTEGKLVSPPDFSSDQAVSDFEATAERCIANRANDLTRVRQALAGNLIPEWKSRLRLDHGGVFGFSFGGTTAIRLCTRDPWFIAGANEDGFYLSGPPPTVPFLYFDDEIPAWLKQPAAADETPEQRLIRRSDERTAEAAKTSNAIRLSLDGTRHESFTDRIYLCPLPRLAKAGRRPAAEIHHTIASALTDLFRRTLGPAEQAAGTR